MTDWPELKQDNEGLSAFSAPEESSPLARLIELAEIRYRALMTDKKDELILQNFSRIDRINKLLTAIKSRKNTKIKKYYWNSRSNTAYIHGEYLLYLGVFIFFACEVFAFQSGSLFIAIILFLFFSTAFFILIKKKEKIVIDRIYLKSGKDTNFVLHETSTWITFGEKLLLRYDLREMSRSIGKCEVPEYETPTFKCVLDYSQCKKSRKVHPVLCLIGLFCCLSDSILTLRKATSSI